MLFRELVMTAFIRTLTFDMDETKKMQKEAARLAHLGYHDGAIKEHLKERRISGHFKTS